MTKAVLKKISLYIICVAGAFWNFLSPGTGTVGFILFLVALAAVAWNLFDDHKTAKEAKAAKVAAEKAEAERLEAERRRPLTEALEEQRQAIIAKEAASDAEERAFRLFAVASAGPEPEKTRALTAWNTAQADEEAAKKRLQKADEAVMEAKAALGEA